MDEDFDIASFDEAYSPDDFDTDDMNFATAVGQQTGGFGDDNTAQVIANQLAQPQVGLNRSNIRGTDNYDPTFAAAFDISRGLDPTGNFQGTGGLAVPSYLRPQIEGRLGPAPGAPKFFSEAERFLQEDLTDFVQSGPGIVGLIGNFLSDNFNDAKKALGLDGGAQGGLTSEDFTGLMSTRDDMSSGTVPMSNMSQQGAEIPVTDPVVTRPADFTGLMSTRTPTFDAFGNVTRDANMSRFRDAFGQINAGIANLLPEQNREANIQVADASNFLNPKALSGGINFFAGPQIQDLIRNVTKNPGITTEIGPRFNVDEQELDNNIFTINVPFKQFGIG